ncbi:MAG: deferrochelatase/peroxidase EfeB [Frankiales bacterium]|nr:deferrochelatase/peroxidase EfeB [Frankiales bacterium]
MSDETAPPRLSRRALLGAFGAGAAAAAVATTGAAVAVSRSTTDSSAAGYQQRFYGDHQHGIATPMQDSLHFVSLDLVTRSREDLVAMLRRWTVAAAALTAGRSVGDDLAAPYDAPPPDSGDALDLPPSGLTVTFGIGPTFFRAPDGTDRFGVAARQPDRFAQLPVFRGDHLDPAICGGDLCIQVCADDAQVAVHAVRNLVRLSAGVARVRWTQLGYAKSSATDHTGPTPRNLMGFKDGTANITVDDHAALDRFVWAQSGDGPAWMDGGTYLVARKIRMTIENWDRTSLREQEGVFGRTKRLGAPLSGGDEFAPLDFTLEGADGEPLVPTDSHVALAHPSVNDGLRILRRSYNYTDGSDDLGRLDAGLFFVAFVRDLDSQFVAMQRRLARADRLNEYVRYLSSAAFAVPPGVGPDGGYVGETLFA